MYNRENVVATMRKPCSQSCLPDDADCNPCDQSRGVDGTVNVNLILNSGNDASSRMPIDASTQSPVFQPYVLQPNMVTPTMVQPMMIEPGIYENKYNSDVNIQYPDGSIVESGDGIIYEPQPGNGQHIPEGHRHNQFQYIDRARVTKKSCVEKFYPEFI